MEMRGKISLLGFGCMRLPVKEQGWQDIDYDKAQQMVDCAIQGGVNYFDTAYIYHEGKSEAFIGHALKKYPRDSFYLADKLPMWLVKTPVDAERLFNEQLEKCQVDYFDYYLMHSLSLNSFEASEQIGVYNLLQKKKSEGKIKKLGFSFHDRPRNLEPIAKAHDWDFGQVQINYLDWELQEAGWAYELLAGLGIPVIVMEPVRGGALATLSQSAADILKKERPQDSIASWAIRFVSELPHVLTVLSGMSTLEQVQDNLRTLSPLEPLTVRERDVLDEALTAYRMSGSIPCTACRYCMDCPAGVDIPRVFTHYNQYQFSEAPDKDKIFTYTTNYARLGEEHHAHNCTECGVCEPRCPQGIDIPQRLKQIAAGMEELIKK